MTTWTSKGPIAALMLLALSACENGQGAALFAGQWKKPKPVSQVTLAAGAVTVFAPRGYCFDDTTVQARFALMARCDILGVPQSTDDMPLAFITVSVLPVSAGQALPSVQTLAAASGLANVSDAQTSDGQITFRATGTAPIGGVSNTHWRGAAHIGTQIVGVSLYGPENGRAVSGEGRSIVSAVISSSKSSS